MTAAAVPTGLVRVTVVGGPRRVDLALPGGVPVVDLAPELARSVGLLGPDTALVGHALVAQDGRRLDGGTGLVAQGVGDGALLTVVAGAEVAAPRVYDDVAEAMADAVSSEVAPWDPAAARRATVGAGALLVALSALAMVLVGGSGGGRIALVVAGFLVVAAVAGERSGLADRHVGLVGALAALHAAVAGLLLVGAGPVDHGPAGHGLAGLVGAPVVAAGVGAAAAGLSVLAGVRSGRVRQLPAVLVGSVLALVGAGTSVAGADPATVLPLVLAVLVLSGSLAPWLALGAAGTTLDQVVTQADVTAGADPIDPGRVRVGARTAHDLLLVVTASVGTSVVLLAPAVVVGARRGSGVGLAAASLAVLACLALLLRARHCRGGSEVEACVVAGVVGSVAVAASALAVHAGWRTGVAVGLAGLGCAALAAGVRPLGASARRTRLLDLLESTVLLALLPLAVVASGLLGRAIG